MEFTSESGVAFPVRRKTVRKIAKGRRNHFTGQFTFGPDEGETMDVESNTELRVAFVTLSRPDVVGLENQVPFAWVKPDGKPATHHFDFRALMANGTRKAIMVKSEYRRLHPEVQLELAQIAAQVTPDFADEVVVMTVRRQSFWVQRGPKLRERLAHLVGLIMRRVACDASGALRAFFV